MSHQDIRIGTLASASPTLPSYLKQIIPHGFESFSITFWQKIDPAINLKTLAGEVKDVLEAASADAEGIKPIISSLGVFGNPLENEETRDGWDKAIDACADFGCDIVAGFAGALAGKSVPDAMPRYKEVFGPLAKKAAGKGVRLAFENCDMGGDWERSTTNIAHAPKAWEMMFDILPAENIGLEWEPCHQMYSLIDPLPQLKQWVDKVFHVHGKDATVHWDVVKTKGIRGGEGFVDHRTPGFGDTNWTDVITILRKADYKGSIDIEGWHDPVYCGELEMTGQVHGCNYLKQCRGGAFVVNPS